MLAVDNDLIISKEFLPPVGNLNVGNGRGTLDPVFKRVSLVTQSSEMFQSS
jgi:hypothetical protein